MSIRRLGSYSSRRVFYLIRNRWLFLLKTYSLRTLLVLLPMLIVYEVAQFLTILKKGWIKEWARSVAWVFRHLPPLLAERRRIKSLRQVADRELITGGALPFRSELTTSRVERFARALLDHVANGYWQLASRLI